MRRAVARARDGGRPTRAHDRPRAQARFGAALRLGDARDGLAQRRGIDAGTARTGVGAVAAVDHGIPGVGVVVAVELVVPGVPKQLVVAAYDALTEKRAAVADQEPIAPRAARDGVVAPASRHEAASG